MTSCGVVAPLLVLLSLLSAHVLGHGRMLVPPGRSSAWRVGFNTTKNYDDNGINCGGTENQWTKNHGKCGVCGDPWQGPRDNEAGGKYASGLIVRKYRRGRIFPVIIELTANHGGWFEFRLCPHNRPWKRISQECLNRFPLRILGDEPFRYTIKTPVSNIAVLLYLQLPYRVICSQCVLQWKYNAAQNLPTGPPEQFINCADIAIYP